MDSSKSKKHGFSDILSRPFSSNEAVGGNNACSSSVTGDEVNVSFPSSFEVPSVQAIMPNCRDCNLILTHKTDY